MHGVHPISAEAVEWFYGSHIPGGPDHGSWLVWPHKVWNTHTISIELRKTLVSLASE